MLRLQYLATQLSLLFFAGLLFTACSKNTASPDPVTNPSTGKKLSKIEYDGGSYESIEYNTNGTINKVTNHIQYTGNADHIVYSFVYNGTELSEIRADNGTKYKYTYNNQQVVKTEIFIAGGAMVAHYDYTYQNGKLWKADGYLRFPGGTIPATPSMRYETEYYADGNPKKMSLYYWNTTNNALEKTNDYVFNQYDSKTNTTALFENNPFLPLDNLMPNNPLSEIHYDENGAIEETLTHTYTYDTDGKPLTRKTISKVTGAAEATENAKFYY